MKQENKGNGARLLIELLQSKGVEVCFGYPGGAVLPLYDEMFKSDLRHILVRHEQGAIHMAEGYAKSTGKIGVCLVTSGPGATNIVTGLTDAKLDSVPVLAITGQVGTADIGTDAFQEADIYGITIPITKYNALIKNENEIARHFEEAWKIAEGGRPGPVLLDVPKDVQNKIPTKRDHGKLKIAAHHYTKPEIDGDLKQLAKKIHESEKPLLYVGGGAIISGAEQEILKLSERANIPVTTTLMGLGAFPGTHKNCLGMLGMHGTAYANKAVLECDLIINIGARFDDRVAKIGEFASNATKVHIDIDHSEFNKRIKVDYKIRGDIKEVLKELLPLIEKKENKNWMQKMESLKNDFPLDYDNSGDSIKPQFMIHKLYEATKGQAIVATDVGQHQMWAAQYYLFDKPRQWLTSGGLGTMGFGLPAAIGAKIGNPEKTVICISGDGSIQMNIQELATMTMNNINVKILLLNNGFLGMVRQWQELFYDERFSHTKWNYNPDFIKIADAYGIKGKRISKKSEVDSALKEFLADDSSFFLEVIIPEDEKVMPMIPAGKSQKDIILFRDIKSGIKK